MKTSCFTIFICFHARILFLSGKKLLQIISEKINKVILILSIMLKKWPNIHQKPCSIYSARLFQTLCMRVNLSSQFLTPPPFKWGMANFCLKNQKLGSTIVVIWRGGGGADGIFLWGWGREWVGANQLQLFSDLPFFLRNMKNKKYKFFSYIVQ